MPEALFAEESGFIADDLWGGGEWWMYFGGSDFGKGQKGWSSLAFRYLTRLTHTGLLNQLFQARTEMK